ncbi:uncharacterized protein LOC135483665 [Lineus longissimus]|uniref:uncharacterized protein LOC135483665 n=1 Tax=Lineus longissimus TaxID=88925 RepID=UPI00315CAB7B
MMTFQILLLLGATLALAFGKGTNSGCAPLDIAFLIDESASIPDKDFKEVLRFSDALVSQLAKDADVKVGIIDFSTEAVPTLWLNDPANNEGASAVGKKFLGVVRSAENFNTNTHLAFFIARTQMLNTSFGVGTRCVATRVVILITDGLPSWPTDAYMEATATLAQDIAVFVIGTGPDDNFGSGMGSRYLLAAYFTGGDVSNVFRATNYAELQSMVASIKGSLCQVSNVRTKASQISKLDTKAYKENPANAANDPKSRNRPGQCK